MEELINNMCNELDEMKKNSNSVITADSIANTFDVKSHSGMQVKIIVGYNLTDE